MKRTSKYRLILGLSMAAVAGNTVLAQDSAAPTVPPPTTTTVTTPPTPAPAPVVINGKIVVVDKIARTITVDVNGKLRLLKVGRKVKMVDNGKLVTFEDLVAGQNIAVLTRETADGSMEVVALSVEPSDAQIEAAGKGNTKPTDKGKGNSGSGLGGGPFQTAPNPANNGGPIISPNN